MSVITGGIGIVRWRHSIAAHVVGGMNRKGARLHAGNPPQKFPKIFIAMAASGSYGLQQAAGVTRRPPTLEHNTTHTETPMDNTAHKAPGTHTGAAVTARACKPPLAPLLWQETTRGKVSPNERKQRNHGGRQSCRAGRLV